MNTYFNKQELLSIIKDFYLLTHIRITVFDKDYQEILSYPDRKAKICEYLRTNSTFDYQCGVCDKAHMVKATKMHEPLLYTCHAGITEIIAPLFLGERVVGFLFFSHILNYKSYDDAFKAILEKTESYQDVYDVGKQKEYISQLSLFSDEYLHAAARLLNETASFLIYNHMAYLKYEDLSSKIDEYINHHISEDLSAKRLCEEFAVGKTYLYQMTNELYGEGLAEHIRKVRLNKAMDMMRENKNVKISYIASKVGFDDYSYFIVMFKKATGMTPKQFSKRLKD